MAELDDITELKIAIGVMQAQVTDVRESSKRIEGKIDAFSYVKKADYDDDRKAADAKFATKEEIKPIKTLFWGVLSTVVLGIATAFVGFVLKGGLK